MRKILVVLFFLVGFSHCTDNGTYTSTDCTPVTIEHKVPEWSKNLSIYELNIRQFSEEGTFKAVEERLDELKDMNVGIIWLMPIHPIGEEDRKGSMGSYYSVKDYKDVNPEFGTKEDFENLVDAIHNKGMYVIIDWVANHTAWDHPWTKTNPEFFTKDSLGNFIPPVEDWSDVIDLNYDNMEMRAEMIDALYYWVEEFDIDGYRCDVASMVPTDFWDEARASLDEIKPVFMLAESEDENLHIKAFDMTYAWDMHHHFNEIAKGNMNADSLKEMIAEYSCRFPDEAYRMVFVDNHDENSWNGTIQERMGNAAETFIVLSAILPGMPLLYSGDEAGMDKSLDFFEKDPIEWKDHPNRKLFTDLFAFKKETPALFNGEFGGSFEIIETKSEHVFAFKRVKDGQEVLVVMNLSDEEVLMKEQYFTFNVNYEELFYNNRDNTPPIDGLKLKPWQYHVWRSF